jgi:hypothetical protein
VTSDFVDSIPAAQLGDEKLQREVAWCRVLRHRSARTARCATRGAAYAGTVAGLTAPPHTATG